MPWDWLISRVCEEFGCLPSAAVRELMDDRDHLALDIMESRAYVRTKEAVARARTEADMPDGPMVEQVFEVEAELLRREAK